MKKRVRMEQPKFISILPSIILKLDLMWLAFSIFHCPFPGQKCNSSFQNKTKTSPPLAIKESISNGSNASGIKSSRGERKGMAQMAAREETTGPRESLREIACGDGYDKIKSSP